MKNYLIIGNSLGIGATFVRNIDNEGLTRSLVTELVLTIRVNSNAPLFTDTPLISRLFSNEEKKCTHRKTSIEKNKLKTKNYVRTI